MCRAQLLMHVQCYLHVSFKFCCQLWYQYQFFGNLVFFLMLWFYSSICEIDLCKLYIYIHIGIFNLCLPIGFVCGLGSLLSICYFLSLKRLKTLLCWVIWVSFEWFSLFFTSKLWLWDFFFFKILLIKHIYTQKLLG